MKSVNSVICVKIPLVHSPPRSVHPYRALLFMAFSPHQLGKIPTRCLPLHWLDGGLARAGNRLTAGLGKESVGAGKQFQIKSRDKSAIDG